MKEQKRRYVLTHPQQRIWYTEKLHPGTGMWNNAGTLKIKGRIDFTLLERAVNMFIEENESVRLRIGTEDGTPYQYLVDYEPLKIDYMDFSGQGIKKLYEWDCAQTQAPMPIIDKNLYYFAFLNLNSEEGWLYVKFHHIICDGLAFVDFGNQITDNYQSLLSGKERPKIKLHSYIDYIQDEADYISSKRFLKDQEYWTNKFKDLPEPTVIKQKKTNYFSTNAMRKTYVLSEMLSDRIRSFCRETGISVFALFLSALAVYINRVTGKKDIIIGAPVANRSSLHSKGYFGMYVSTVPVRIMIEDDISFTEFARVVSNQWFSVLKHQKYPYDMLMQELRKEHKGLESLYDVTLSYQVGKFEKNTEEFTYEGRWHFSGSQSNSLSIHVNDREDNGRFIVDYDHHTPFFSEKEIEYYHVHISNILLGMIENPEKKLFAINLMSDEERNRVLYEFNKTGRKFPEGETLTDLWYKHIKSISGDAEAVVCGGQAMTYGELDARSSALAHYLVKQGIKPGFIVGLLVKRSWDYCVSVIAILKAGGAFLPIDAELPKERITYMLSDCKAKAVIVSPGLQGQCSGMDICVIKTNLPLAIPHDTYIKPECRPDDLAYVIYTSGSTGQPKGVQIEHRSAVHFVYSMNEIWKFKRDSRILCAASFSFDMSIMEFLPAVLSGATTVLAQEHEVNIPRNIARLIQSAGVNMFMATPGRMELLLSDKLGSESLKGFRNISMGGDVLPEKLLERVRKVTSARIMNFYGPTEITVCATYTDLTNAKIPNIGRPMFNVKAYILDEHMNPVPIGVPGELYIGGVGVSRGYINKPELNTERFIKNPFADGEKIYRTGDLARWYPQGEIEFLGRIDKQVKIRGYRIELGEIESRIMQLQGVKACAVSDRTDTAGRKFLCAYIVGDPPKKTEVKAQLTRDLPSYMIPSYFITLEDLPLSASGKVDREKLPDPLEDSEVEDNYRPPETATEQILADIWSNVLNTRNIGRDDSFFDIGGDSLSIVKVISQVVQSFHVEISLEDVYRSPSLMDIAVLIDKASLSAYRPIIQAPEMEDYPPSSAQQRMWVLSQNNPDSIAYNIPAAIDIRGELNIPRIREALEKVIERHEIFRTSYFLRDGELRQKINKNSGFKLEMVKCEPLKVNDILQSLIKPFDLSKTPVIRATLIETGRDMHTLFIDMHHIAGDKRTGEIFLRELSEFYSGRTPDSNTIEYKDYAVWQQESMNSDSISIQREYWSGALAGELPLLNLHTDRPRAAVQKFQGSQAGFEIKGEALRKLRAIAQQNGATLFTVILAVYNILLSKYTGQEDIIIGIPVTGRKREELSEIAGIFINTVPLRNYPRGDLKFTEFLADMNRNTVAALAHSEYPLELIISDLSIHRDMSRNPLFDTMISFAGSETHFRLEGAECRIIPLDTKTAKFDLMLEANEGEETLKCRFEYNTRLFRRSTIKRMIVHFCRLAEILSEEQGVRLSDIEMMTQQEIWQVTQGFNRNDLPLDPRRSIQSIFEDKAEKYPNKNALIVSGKKMTFDELNRKANKTARWLREKGIGRNSIVAVCLHRSEDLLVTILGVLKAGGAFLPVDPELPTDRIRFMLSDTGAKLVITDRDSNMEVCGTSYSLSDVPDGLADDNLIPVESTEDAAYVIFTSGSTGIPKGTILPRRGICNLYESVKLTVGYNIEDVCVSMATISFDMFISEVILPLLCGCTIALCTDEEQRQPHLLATLIESVQASCIQATPTRLQIMMADKAFRSAVSKHVRKILLGGEMVPLSLLKLLRKYTNAKIWDQYGPSEASAYSSIKDLSKTDHITIGKPVTNTRIYILNKNQRPVPIGVVGEACISGAGVSISGYINRDELSRTRFIPDPYWPGRIMYRTGDVCAYLENGEIEMCGRADHQVKMRGLRIELGEIEAAVRQVKGVGEAIVKDWGEGVNKYLCAYYTSENAVSVETIRKHLRGKLPAYMVPSVFEAVKEMPMTLSGKIDRKALSEPKNRGERREANPKYTEMTETEKKMGKVWERILKTNGISADEDFFALGGDSLGVIKVQSAIFQYGWSIRTKDFYESRTLRAVCSNINRNGDADQKAEKKERNIFIPEFGHLKGFRLKNVLITGATGYLGAHILERLTRSAGVNAYCLVRGTDDKKSEKYLRDILHFYFGAEECARILKSTTVIRGNITYSGFGLKSEFSSAVKIDTVIHCAAITDHFGQAEKFYKTNVLGTKHAVEFAKTLNADFLHVSTCSVSGKYYVNDRERRGEFDESCLYVGQDYSFNEYVKSKYEAEKIVLDAIKRGLNARIFRVGLLTGTLDGRFQAHPERNAFANRIRALCDLGCIPTGKLQTKFEMTPVDSCAEAILILSAIETGNSVFHMFNSNEITLGDIVSMLNENGYPIEIVDDEEFLNRMRQASKKGKLNQLNGLINDITENETARIKITNSITSRKLEAAGFHWPVIDSGYFERFLNCINDSGFKEV